MLLPCGGQNNMTEFLPFQLANLDLCRYDQYYLAAEGIIALFLVFFFLAEKFKLSYNRSQLFSKPRNF